jgi:hypothetical protein
MLSYTNRILFKTLISIYFKLIIKFNAFCTPIHHINQIFKFLIKIQLHRF